MNNPETNTDFLCRKSVAPELIRRAEKERYNILEELKAYYTGDIDVRIYPVSHVAGTSIAGDLTVNGEVCRHYDPVGLCFLDLNELMLRRLIEARPGGAGHG